VLPAVPHLFGEPRHNLFDHVALIMKTEEVGDLLGEPSPIAFRISGTKPARFDFGPSGLKSAFCSRECVGVVERRKWHGPAR